MADPRYFKSNLLNLPATAVFGTDDHAALLVHLDSEAIDAGPAEVSQGPATVPAVVSLQTAISANANGTALDTTGYATAVLQITSSPAMSGGTQVNFEASADDGVTWVPISTVVNGFVQSFTTIDGDYRFHVSGFTRIRARISAYSAGTVTVKAYLSPLPSSPYGVSLEAAQTPTATTMQSAAGTGNPSGTSLNILGEGTAIINIVSSTPMSGGTIVNFEVSVDDVTWSPTFAQKVGTGLTALTTSADGDYRIPMLPGFKSLRARISGWVAGVTTIKGYCSPSVAQFAHIFDSAGNMLVSLGTNIAGEDTTPGQQVMGVVTKPVIATTYAPTIDTDYSTVAAKSTKGTAGAAFRIRVASKDPAQCWVQLHNKATIPLAGEVPIAVFGLPAGTATQWAEIEHDFYKYFSLGIGWGISSTPGTYTAVATPANFVMEELAYL